MRCARPDCTRPADAVVDVGEGLLVMLCAHDGLRAVVRAGGESPLRILSELPRRRGQTVRSGRAARGL